jgi:hypothetical protein
MIPEVGEKGKPGQKAACINCTVAFLLLPKEAKDDILCPARAKRNDRVMLEIILPPGFIETSQSSIERQGIASTLSNWNPKQL